MKRFNANRNWFLIAFAVGSPYYWIQYLLANLHDTTAVLISAAFLIFAVVLLVFLFRKHYIEVGTDQILVKSPVSLKIWTPADINQLSVSKEMISLADNEGRVHHLMIPQKPKDFQALQQAVQQFGRRHKIPTTDQPFDLRKRNIT